MNRARSKIGAGPAITHHGMEQEGSSVSHRAAFDLLKYVHFNLIDLDASQDRE